MMDPVDFLKTAESLMDSPREPDIRTSVGRSYYGVFLYFRERLACKGLYKQINSDTASHDFIIQCLMFCNEKIGQVASSRLKTLKQKRRSADYRLGDQFSSNDSSDALEMAKLIISDFEKITIEEETRLIENAIKHARLKDWIR